MITEADVQDADRTLMGSIMLGDWALGSTVGDLNSDGDKGDSQFPMGDVNGYLAQVGWSHSIAKHLS